MDSVATDEKDKYEAGIIRDRDEIYVKEEYITLKKIYYSLTSYWRYVVYCITGCKTNKCMKY